MLLSAHVVLSVAKSQFLLETNNKAKGQTRRDFRAIRENAMKIGWQ